MSTVGLRGRGGQPRCLKNHREQQQQQQPRHQLHVQAIELNCGRRPKVCNTNLSQKLKWACVASFKAFTHATPFTCHPVAALTLHTHLHDKLNTLGNHLNPDPPALQGIHLHVALFAVNLQHNSQKDNNTVPQIIETNTMG